MAPLHVHLIAGARPNFMKVAPVYHALAAAPWARPVLVHTGQHYDVKMSDDFFRDLRLPAPDFHLGVGSGSHAEQTARVMVAYEQVCLERRPDWVVVVGDVNSTVASALVAAKLRLPLAHLEAGLRSYDRDMPEEINRVVTDALADLLWTPSPDADRNLAAEGIAAARIERVGNVMIDAFVMLRERIEADPARARFGFGAGEYGVVTLHRPSNVDHRDRLALILRELSSVARRMPVIFPLHPRTKQRLEDFGWLDGFVAAPGVHAIEPLGYVAFMSLVREAGFVITDSGGIQEETTYLDIPCVTLRTTTERPITVSQGSNQLSEPEALGGLVARVLDSDWPGGRCPELWDGRTAERVAASLEARLE